MSRWSTSLLPRIFSVPPVTGLPVLVEVSLVLPLPQAARVTAVVAAIAKAATGVRPRRRKVIMLPSHG